MASAHRTISLAAVLLAVPGLAWADPLLQGDFRSEQLGRLMLRTEEGRVSGVATEERGACGFAPNFRVLEGELQGNVLVGSVKLCLKGAACPRPEASYPILGFFNPSDGVLAAHVRLEEGCQSPGLKGSLLVLQPVVAAPEVAPSAVQETASTVARRRMEKRNSEAARQAALTAWELLRASQVVSAARGFEESLAYDDREWRAYAGLGTIRLLRHEPREALELLEQARKLSPKSPDLYYGLASAYSQLNEKEKALVFLRKAADLGFDRHDELQKDADMARLLGSEPRFHTLSQRVFENQQKARR